MVCTPASSGQCRTRNQQNDYTQPIPDCDAILLVMLAVNTANDTGWQNTCTGDDYQSAGAGGNRPLLFVIATPFPCVIASPDLSGRGNLIGAEF
jgi:hypothetical protein